MGNLELCTSRVGDGGIAMNAHHENENAGRSDSPDAKPLLRLTPLRIGLIASLIPMIFVGTFFLFLAPSVIQRVTSISKASFSLGSLSCSWALCSGPSVSSPFVDSRRSSREKRNEQRVSRV